MGQLLLSLSLRSILGSVGPPPHVLLPRAPEVTVAEGQSVPSPDQTGCATLSLRKVPQPPRPGLTHLFPQPPSTQKAPTSLFTVNTDLQL